MFSTNGMLQQEEYIPLVLWIVYYAILSLHTDPICVCFHNCRLSERVRFSLKCEWLLMITKLASFVNPLHLATMQKGGKVGKKKGGGRGGDAATTLQPCQTNADAFSQQTQRHTHPPTPHPATAHDTERCALQRKARRCLIKLLLFK